jgi:hypothetical protein
MTTSETTMTCRTDRSHAACQIVAAIALIGLWACSTGPVIVSPQAGAGGAPPSAGASRGAAKGGSASSLCALDGGDAELKPSDYDQSCKLDSDCVSVPAGNVCLPCVRSCSTGTVGQQAATAYRAAIAKLVPAGEPDVICHCPALFNPCCIDNLCHSDPQCQSSH